MTPRGAWDEQSGAGRGHRTTPHTADCFIEAWGPDRVSCLVEAVEALVETFAAVEDTATTQPLPLSAQPGTDAEILVSLLEEVIYTVDVFAAVPVRVHLAETEDGGVAGDMEVATAGQVKLVGPLPKAVSYHGLEIAEHGNGWRCRAVVDV